MGCKETLTLHLENVEIHVPYPIKNGSNPPNPGPSPPSLITLLAKCDDYYACPIGITCCYAYGISNFFL